MDGTKKAPRPEPELISSRGLLRVYQPDGEFVRDFSDPRRVPESVSRAVHLPRMVDTSPGGGRAPGAGPLGLPPTLKVGALGAFPTDDPPHLYADLRIAVEEPGPYAECLIRLAYLGFVLPHGYRPPSVRWKPTKENRS